MTARSTLSRVRVLRHVPLITLALTFAWLIGAIGAPEASFNPWRALRGIVEGNGARQDGYTVSLYASYLDGHPVSLLLGTDVTDRAGRFGIRYKLPPGVPRRFPPVLYLLAEKDQAMLASAVGPVSKKTDVVVNERTTVAIGFAFAQFVDGRVISGNTYGMLNAVHMAANLADPKTGEAGDVLTSYPNGATTSTLGRFNALGNMVANCVVQASGCDDLFARATPDGGAPPPNVLQAVANIARDPSWKALELYELSNETVFYAPTPDAPPDAWTLVLRFGDTPTEKGPDNLLNGPGNFAIDERGFLWVNNNYVPRMPEVPACASLRLVKFYPWGELFPRSPYFGGGLSGAGYGIGIDPRGHVWVGNFGFEAPECANPNVPPFPDPAKKIPALHNSVSEFRPNGQPISPDPEGFTAGSIFWPQATVSDRKGNIWIANCGNDSLTVLRKGNPTRAHNIDLQPPPGNPGELLIKPFGMAIDLEGNAWVTGNKSETLTVVSRDGRVEVLSPTNANGQVLYKPMAVAADSKGNMWVANSDTVDVPCPPPITNATVGPNASVALYMAGDRQPHQAAPFTGGGITIPWGISVDGNDTVWVANFGITAFDGEEQAPSDLLPRLSQFCGVDTAKCPARAQAVGAAISPANGYTSDALQRNTTTAIDPSGNVWLTNNWRIIPPAVNPGGNAIVVYIGIAKPIATPLIGPPVPFGP